MKLIRTAVISLWMLSYSFGCWALTLEQAKNQGLVGESLSGYLVVRKADPEVEILIQQVNNKRKEQYQRVAQSTGSNLEEVEQRSGQKLIERAQAGEWIQGLSRQWRQK
jgi:uncharacterized protein YdbL (DUF1318 family)